MSDTSFPCRVVPASFDDVSAMVGLLEELFTIETDFVVDRVKHERGLCLLLKDRRAMVLIAKVGTTVVGMATCQEVISTATGGISGLIEDVVVSAVYRGKGIGGQLVRAIQERAVKQGYVRLQLAADLRNEAALRFYRDEGFVGTNMGIVKKALS